MLLSFCLENIIDFSSRYEDKRIEIETEKFMAYIYERDFVSCYKIYPYIDCYRKVYTNLTLREYRSIEEEKQNRIIRQIQEIENSTDCGYLLK